MSTKIYTAYRTKPKVDFWKLAIDIKRQGRKNISKVIESVIEKMLTSQSVDLKNADMAKGEPHTPSSVSRYLNKLYRNTLGKYTRDVTNFDVTVSVRKQNNRYYLIPYCDALVCDVLDFMKKDERLEDFSYWNNTDPPEGFSYAQWSRRGKIWEPMLEKDCFSDFITIDIMSWDAWIWVDPSTRMSKKKKWKPYIKEWQQWYKKSQKVRSKK